ncbi:MAG: HAD-IA family hydrolase [Fluviibacter sp.]
MNNRTYQYDLVVFDWDGTLLDSTGAIVKAIQSASRDVGATPPTNERARYAIGLGLRDALLHAVPDLPESRYDDLVDAYRKHYLSGDHELCLFEGVEMLLQQLQAEHRWIAVATGKSRLGLDRALGHSGLGRYFDTTRTADETRGKPHPQMLEEIMNQFAVAPERTLMIGDTTHDLLMAQNAGAKGLGITHGAHQVSALLDCRPVGLVDSIPDLANWMKTNG